MRRARRTGAVHDEARDALAERRLQRIPHRLELAPMRLALGDRELHRPRQSDRHRDVLGAGATPPILRPTEEEGLERGAAPDIEAADPLRRPELVPAHRGEVEGDPRRIDLDLPEGLHGVGVEEGAMGLRERGQLGDRLHDPGLVVHPHHRGDGDVIGGELRLGIGQIDGPARDDGEDPLLRPLLGRLMRGDEDRLVLGRGGHHRTLPVRLETPPRPEDGEVVGLGPAGGEADLVGGGVEALGDPLARLVERRPGLTAPPVRGARVPEAGAEERRHRLEDLRADRGRGGMVEVDRGGGHTRRNIPGQRLQLG